MASKTTAWRRSSRRSVFERDNYTCQLCLVFFGREREGELTVDHVTPTALGGSNAQWNKQCACKPCNHRKGNTIVPRGAYAERRGTG